MTTLFSYLPAEDAVAICKLAELSEPEKQKRSIRPMVNAAVGFGAGTLAGYGGGKLLDAASRHFTGKEIPAKYLAPATAVLGGGLGLAYNMAQAHYMEELKRALENSDNQPAGVDR